MHRAVSLRALRHVGTLRVYAAQVCMFFDTMMNLLSLVGSRLRFAFAGSRGFQRLGDELL